jgi:hypothetical protein
MNALPSIVQNSRHTGLSLTWLAGSAAKDLTGATLTGTITDASGNTRAITGTLNIVNPTAGTFTWAFSTIDVATVGNFTVQFTATYSSDSLPDTSYELPWAVVDKR